MCGGGGGEAVWVTVVGMEGETPSTNASLIAAVSTARNASGGLAVQPTTTVSDSRPHRPTEAPGSLSTQ